MKFKRVSKFLGQTVDTDEVPARQSRRGGNAPIGWMPTSVKETKKKKKTQKKKPKTAYL